MLIYVGHKNENIVKKETIQFSLIYVGHRIYNQKYEIILILFIYQYNLG